MAFDFSQSYIGFNSENSSFNFLKFISMCEDHDQNKKKNAYFNNGIWIQIKV